MSRAPISQILFHISPPPRNVSETRDVYRAIKKFGQVELFKVVRFTTTTNLPAPTVHVIFRNQPRNLPRSFQVVTTPPKPIPALELPVSLSDSFIPRHLTVTPLPSNFDHREHIRKVFKAVAVNGIKGLRSRVDPEDVGKESETKVREKLEQGQYSRLLAHYAGGFKGLDAILELAKGQKGAESTTEVAKQEKTDPPVSSILQPKKLSSWKPTGLDTKREYHTASKLRNSSGINPRAVEIGSFPADHMASTNEPLMTTKAGLATPPSFYVSSKLRKRPRPIPYRKPKEASTAQEAETGKKGEGNMETDTKTRTQGKAEAKMQVKTVLKAQEETGDKILGSPAKKVYAKLYKAAIRKADREMLVFLNFREYYPLPPIRKPQPHVSDWEILPRGWSSSPPPTPEPKELRPSQYAVPARLKLLPIIPNFPDWKRHMWFSFRKKYVLPPVQKERHLLHNGRDLSLYLLVTEDGWDRKRFLKARRHWDQYRKGNRGSTTKQSGPGERNNPRQKKANDKIYRERMYSRTVRSSEMEKVKGLIESRYKEILDARGKLLFEREDSDDGWSKWELPPMMRMEYKSLKKSSKLNQLGRNPIPQLFTTRGTPLIHRVSVDLRSYNDSLFEDINSIAPETPQAQKQLSEPPVNSAPKLKSKAEPESKSALKPQSLSEHGLPGSLSALRSPPPVAPPLTSSRITHHFAPHDSALSVESRPESVLELETDAKAELRMRQQPSLEGRVSNSLTSSHFPLTSSTTPKITHHFVRDNSGPQLESQMDSKLESEMELKSESKVKPQFCSEDRRFNSSLSSDSPSRRTRYGYMPPITRSSPTTPSMKETINTTFAPSPTASPSPQTSPRTRYDYPTSTARPLPTSAPIQERKIDSPLSYPSTNSASSPTPPRIWYDYPPPLNRQSPASLPVEGRPTESQKQQTKTYASNLSVPERRNQIPTSKTSFMPPAAETYSASPASSATASRSLTPPPVRYPINLKPTKGPQASTSQCALWTNWNPHSQASIDDFMINIETPAELELLELATQAEGKQSSRYRG